MDISPDIRRQIADAVIAAESKMEFSVCLHPLNAKEQKEKFLAGAIEEPIFSYSEPSIPALDVPVFSVESELDALYRDRIGHTKGLSLLLQLAGRDQEFSELSQVLFPVTPVGEPLSSQKEEEKPSVGAETIVQSFREALKACDCEGWNVEVAEHCSSRMYVNQWEKKIAVRSDVLVTKEELAALTRHEIGVHVVRYDRGAKQKEPLLRIGTLLGRTAEEGVACFLENPEGHARLYERHVAVTTALNHSFRETWQQLCDGGCTPEEAWIHTLRVKRGMTDGASHGAFTRDAIYAQGFEVVRAYARGGGTFEPLLSAPIHPEEVTFFTEECAMEVFPLPPFLQN